MESKTAHKRKPALEEKMRTIVVIMMEVGAHPQKHQQQQQQKKLVSGGNDSNDTVIKIWPISIINIFFQWRRRPIFIAQQKNYGRLIYN